MKPILMVSFLFFSVSILYASDPYQNSAKEFGFHRGFTRGIEEKCSNLRVKFSVLTALERRKYPNHYSENDKRWNVFDALSNQGHKQGFAAAQNIIKNTSVENYCKHLIKKYGPSGEVISLRNFIVLRVVTKEEKVGLRNYDLLGCKTVLNNVFVRWPCDLEPAAQPKKCKESKATLLKNGDCIKTLRVISDELALTGKNHKLVMHRQFTGIKSSGPFVQVKANDGRVWWLDEYDWKAANQKKSK